MRIAAAFFPLAISAPAFADPPAETESAPPPKSGWFDGACSFTTAMFEQRVLEEGSDYAYTGHLSTVDAPLDNHVDAPFVVGEDTATRVIDTHIIHPIVPAVDAGERVTIQGKRLMIGEVAYIAATVATVDTPPR